MSLASLVNLYEVTKTIHFELVPTKYTKPRIDKEFDGVRPMDDAEFKNKAVEILQFVESLLSIFKSGGIDNLQAGKDFMKYLNPELINASKKEAKNNLWLKVIIDKKENRGLGFGDDYRNKIDYLLELITNAQGEIQYLDSDFKVSKKVEIHRAFKRVAYVLNKVDEFLGFINLPHGYENVKFQDWKFFRDIEANKSFFQYCKTLRSSKKDSGENEWARCSANSRALNKKSEFDKIKIEVEKLKIDLEKNEQKKHEYIMKMKDWNEAHEQEKLSEENRLVNSGIKKGSTLLRKELEKWRESSADYFFEDDIQKGVQTFSESHTLTWWKTYYSKKLGEIRQKIHSKEEEIYRQESIKYFSALVRNGERYYLIFVDKEQKEQILNGVSIEGNDSEVLEYHSLTFKAFMKIAEREGIKTSKNIIEKIRFPKENDKYSPTLIDRQGYIRELSEILKRVNSKYENGLYNLSQAEMNQIISSGDLQKFQVFINENCYKKIWKPCNWKKIEELDEKNILWVFQLRNKDFPLSLEEVERLKKEKGKEYVEKKRKDRKKESLFTQYWRECLEDNLEHIHIAPESRIYLREAKSEDEISEMQAYKTDKQIGKLRFKERKIIGDFQLIFYPARKTELREIQDRIKSEFNNSEVSFIGIDRGEGSIANYFVLDSRGNPKLDSQGKVIKGDMTVVTTMGEFVSLSDCYISNSEVEQYFRGIQKLDTSGKNMLKNIRSISRLFPEIFANGFKWEDISIEDLKNMKSQLLDVIHPNKIQLKYRNCDNVEVPAFDYRYAFNHMRFLSRVQYEIQLRLPGIPGEFSESGDEDFDNKMKKFTAELLDSEKMKKGYVSAFISKISELVTQYNGVVVFEDLNEIYDKDDQSGEEENYLSGIRESGLTPRQKNVLRGVSVYQMIEEKLISKFGYLHTDSILGTQSTPKINNLGLLRYATDEQKKIPAVEKIINDYKNQSGLNSIDTIGNILYVPENNTSKKCPECGFEGIDPEKDRISVIVDEDGIVQVGIMRLVFGKIFFDKLVSENDLYVTESKQRKDLIKDFKKYILLDGKEFHFGSSLNIEYLKDNQKKVFKFGGFFNTRDKNAGDRVMCFKCGFDTQNDSKYNILSGDELAAYNIAKKGYKRYINTNIS